jgi:uridine phosphorylase
MKKRSKSLEEGILLQHDDVLIEPRRIDEEPVIGPEGIIFAIPSDLDFVVELSKAKQSKLRLLSPFRLFLAKRKGHSPVALAGPALGAPHAVMVMEKLIALGAKRIWFLGWCGSLQPDLSIGDLIIPITAVSEEGTSRHYPVPRKKCQASPHMNRLLEASLSKAGLRWTRGQVWTTDAIYRETRRKTKEYRRKGILAVEMEISALISVSIYRSVGLAALLIVSDELGLSRWKIGFRREDFRRRTKEIGQLVYNMCMSLSKLG